MSDKLEKLDLIKFARLRGTAQRHHESEELDEIIGDLVNALNAALTRINELEATVDLWKREHADIVHHITECDIKLEDLEARHEGHRHDRNYHSDSGAFTTPPIPGGDDE